MGKLFGGGGKGGLMGAAGGLLASDPILGSVGLTGLTKKMLGGKKPGAAAAGAAATMPDPDDEAVSAARRRRLAQMQNRGGRQSTILSQSETLGGS